MKSKEDLFHLIKAMSKSEKRYFTLDAQKGGRKGSRYLELFQAINEMEEYDESRLKKKFPKSLPSDKAYLYQAILRSMRDYRSSKSRSAQIKEMILDARYLYERGLYGQSEERLQEAKELAKQLDDRLSLLEINREQLNLVWNTRKNYYDILIDRLIEEEEMHITAVTEEFKYLGICNQLTAALKKNFDLSDTKWKTALQQQFPPAFFDSTSEPGALHARRRFYQSVALYHQLTGDISKVIEYYAKVVDWWDENTKYKEDEFFRYIIDISNLLHAYSSQAQYDKLPPLLQKLENEPVESTHDKGIVFQKVALYKLMYYINTGHLEGVQAFIGEVDQGLAANPIAVGSKLAIIFNMAVLLFIQEEFGPCKQWCSKIINSPKTVSRQDIQKAVHLLYLIAVFEEGDPEELDNTIRSLQRSLHSREEKTKGRFEWTVIDFIKRIAYSPLGEMRQEYENLRRYLMEVKTNPEEVVALGLDELVMLWVRSKLQKQSIGALLHHSKSA